jgi:hypothetical protein
MNRFHYSSILNIPANKEVILDALSNLPTRVTPSLHFGSGESARLFMVHLRNPKLWQTSRQKYFQDLDLSIEMQDVARQV